MMKRYFVLGGAMLGLTLLPAKAPTPAAPAFDSAFWKQWGDGQAELSGYDLTFPRYGDLRHGVAVTVFVTEMFSNSLRVKADPGKHPAGDQFPVMKLNLVEDFQTGIYDYNLMTSSFVALAPVNGRAAGTPVKISFSSQEWCGQTYQQLLFDPHSIRSASHSYFDGEADQQGELSYPQDGLSEDELYIWARGQAEPHLAPGEQRTVQLLTSLETARLAHVPLAWNRATVSRTRGQRQITVPAGNFKVEEWSVNVPGGVRRTYYVEAAEPHRIVRWEASTGERADLLGSGRMKYWQMNGPGFERALKTLGLAPRPPRTT